MVHCRCFPRQSHPAAVGVTGAGEGDRDAASRRSAPSLLAPGGLSQCQQPFAHGGGRSVPLSQPNAEERLFLRRIVIFQSEFSSAATLPPLPGWPLFRSRRIFCHPQPALVLYKL
jgi:hypothetical protein